MALSFVAVLPIGILVWAQPSTPQLKAHNQQMVSSYISQQKQPANMIANAYQETPLPGAENAEAMPAQAQEDLTAATLVSSLDSTNPNSAPTAPSLTSGSKTGASAGSQNVLLSSEEKAYRYNLTLAQGFLRKAVQTSQTTASTQTADDQANILNYLEQALTAANTAVELNPTNGLGFLLRARVYKTASGIKPELAAKGDQDLTIAQALGVQDIDILSENVLDQLPTQQATNLAGGPIVADAEEGSNTTVQTETLNNATQGEIILPAGEVSVFVPYTALNNTMQISVEVSPNSLSQPQTPLRVSSRKSGEGFTIQSFNSLSEDVTLFWRIVE